MIYLHAGSHKTASTLIQMSLNLNAHLLPFTYDRQIDALSGILFKQSPLPRKQINKLRRLWNKSYPGDVLTSCEGYMGNFIEAYNNTTEIANDLHSIWRDHEVKVIAYFRSQESFIEETYAQMVKGGYHKKFEEFLMDYDWRKLNWYDKCHYYALIFGSIKALPYPHPNKEYVNTLLRECNCNVTIEYNTNIISNPSLSKEGLDLALPLNRFLNEKQQWGWRGFLERYFNKSWKEPYDLLTDGQREIISDYFKESNEEMWRVYG